MSTKLKGHLVRETPALIQEKGTRNLVITLTDTGVEIRPKGLNGHVYWSYAHLYTLGIIQGRMRK